MILEAPSNITITDCWIAGLILAGFVWIELIIMVLFAFGVAGYIIPLKLLREIKLCRSEVSRARYQRSEKLKSDCVHEIGDSYL